MDVYRRYDITIVNGVYKLFFFTWGHHPAYWFIYGRYNYRIHAYNWGAPSCGPLKHQLAPLTPQTRSAISTVYHGKQIQGGAPQVMFVGL